MLKNNKKKLRPSNYDYTLITGLLADELKDFIDKRIKSNDDSIKKSELKEIAEILLPDIDILISMKIKKHMQFLGEKLIDSSK